jgi:potassium efflux system protein
VKILFRGLPLALFFLTFWAASAAQTPFGFDELAAKDELQSITLGLDNEDIDSEFLTDSHSSVLRIHANAIDCTKAAGEELARLDERFEPLKEVTTYDVSQDFIDQRNAISLQRDEVIAAQSRCTTIADEAGKLRDQITNLQTELSQRFLSSPSRNVIQLILEFPARAASWPATLRESMSPELVDDLEPTDILWLILLAGFAAAMLGLLSRVLFAGWYARAGGDDASPSFRYLLLKPVAEFAPLWLIGGAFLLVLKGSIVHPDIDLLVIRVAWAILMFGTACVVINWATGPLSPSVEVKGLIPDHVDPIRLRLRILFMMISTSFVVLGSDWLSIRVVDEYVSGRASMIFLVAVAFIYLFTYLPNIPGVKGHYRLLRTVAMAATVVCILAVFTGYQNFAAFLIHGITRTGLASFFLWILLWLVYISFEYLINQETPAAAQARAALGISKTGKGTGIGFMRLIADLVLWISFAVYMIYVWDESGSTLGKLIDNIKTGWAIGPIQLVPIKIIGGILIFAGVIIVIGWLKRWIDRRWLKQIVMERGAREAIVTLIGYVGFVVALFIALAIAEVDLTGLALISGALALGIGFGMQEIASNFVSGLILLFERPIRAGDFVTVGDVEGYVRSIRIRATEIETLDNQNVLVPNSELVSGRVTNWVLRDAHGRLQVRIGVAYGSDIKKVKDILESVSREHPEIITDGRAPAPRALFMNFGDSSLDFELRVRVQRIERRFSVKSDLNFAIDAAFREAGISIPFPQRDLHIVSYPEHAIETAAKVEPAKPTKSAKPADSVPTHVEYSTRKHEAEITVAADIKSVWKALTDIEELKRWLIIDGEFTSRIGGEYDLTLRDDHHIAGRIDIYIPLRRIRAVIAARPEEGPLATGPITIDFLFRSEGGKTTVTSKVEGIPDSEDWEEFYRLSEDRWKNALADLKTYVLTD